MAVFGFSVSFEASGEAVPKAKVYLDSIEIDGQAQNQKG